MGFIKKGRSFSFYSPPLLGPGTYLSFIQFISPRSQSEPIPKSLIGKLESQNGTQACLCIHTIIASVDQKGGCGSPNLVLDYHEMK